MNGDLNMDLLFAKCAARMTFARDLCATATMHSTGSQSLFPLYLLFNCTDTARGSDLKFGRQPPWAPAVLRESL